MSILKKYIKYIIKENKEQKSIWWLYNTPDLVNKRNQGTYVELEKELEEMSDKDFKELSQKLYVWEGNKDKDWIKNEKFVEQIAEKRKFQIPYGKILKLNKSTLDYVKGLAFKNGVLKKENRIDLNLYKGNPSFVMFKKYPNSWNENSKTLGVYWFYYGEEICGSNRSIDFKKDDNEKFVVENEGNLTSDPRWVNEFNENSLNDASSIIFFKDTKELENYKEAYEFLIEKLTKVLNDN